MRLLNKIVIGLFFLISVSGFVPPSTRVIATVYHAEAAQCNSDYWHTASNKEIDTLNPLSHRWIAVSRDLESKGFVFGKKVIIRGVGSYSGEWTIQDRMNKRYVSRIDLLIGKKDALGKWDKATIELID